MRLTYLVTISNYKILKFGDKLKNFTWWHTSEEMFILTWPQLPLE